MNTRKHHYKRERGKENERKRREEKRREEVEMGEERGRRGTRKEE